MSQEQIDILQRALNREKAARKAAEKILEDKSRELYVSNTKLEQLNKDLESLLTRKDSQLQGVFENIVDAYVIIDLEGNIMKMNDAAVALLGFKSAYEDFNLIKLVQPQENEQVLKSFKELLDKGSITNFHVNIITNKQEAKIVHINASIIYDQGIPVAAQGIVRDITKQKADEENLIESENRLASLIANLDSGVLLEDEKRKIVLTNRKFCELFGIEASLEQLKGIDCSKTAEQNKILFKNPDVFIKRIDEILKNKIEVIGDELETIDGKILERDYIPVYHKKTYKGHLWTYKDVTLKRKYRKSLEAERLKYYNIISNMNLGLVEVDLDDKILMVNQSFINMTGYSEKELIGIKGKDLLPIIEDQDLLKEKVEDSKKGKTESYELRIKNKQGDEKYWLVSGAPNYDLNGNIIGSIGVNFDITEIKNLQLQKENLLKKLEKSNDELHEYAHVVSHDLKSPLRSINALVSWLKTDNENKLDDASLQNFALIEATLEKMEQLITDVLQYSSIGAEDTEKESVNIQAMVNDLLKIVYIPDHINVTIQNTLPTINGNKIKLQQLFQNLISNAIKFIDKKVGIININVDDLTTHYQFSIKDNGIGIEKKYHDKIFKIFHSLNKSKESSGIGLSIVKKIVDLHQGKVWVESEIDQGSTFYFTIKKT